VSDMQTAAEVAASQPWQLRVSMAVTNAAVDILNEDEDAASHDARERLAKAVIRNEPLVMMSWPRLVLTNETVRAAVVADAGNFGAAVPDGDIEFTVASLWTAVAKSLNY
jgi:hypothetical protein